MPLHGSLGEQLIWQAFITFVNTHILFSAKSQNPLPAAQACSLVIESEVQHRLGGAFQAAVERYASDKETADEADNNRPDEEDEGKLAVSKYSLNVGADLFRNVAREGSS